MNAAANDGPGASPLGDAVAENTNFNQWEHRILLAKLILIHKTSYRGCISIQEPGGWANWRHYVRNSHCTPFSHDDSFGVQ